jgi:hypothetical protein
MDASGFRRGSEVHMGDVLYVGLTVGFFAVSWLYVKGLERL